MYQSHNLRSNLQEWKNRMSRASISQFGGQVKYFLSKIESEKLIMGIVQEVCLKYPYTEDTLKKTDESLENGDDLSFENDEHHAAFGYQFLKYLIRDAGYEDLNKLTMFMGRDIHDCQENLIEQLITPLLYYLHDQLDTSNSIIYLLEKYKMRTEWFMKKKLSEQYSIARANYEQIFEDHLRLYLFDQGIDYPFSTPKSMSGRADIVGQIDTDNPIVIEIKIFDRIRGYGKNRIKESFSQIVKYTGDFNKDFGYLIIFNMDKAELDFKFPNSRNVFPPTLNYNNKQFFFVVINCLEMVSASKLGKVETIEINEADII
ncbi:hypothetical protein OQZ33_23350 [Pedobacter sp. MC2016-05]|uniref:hypothetical protein n=1 Tax=Pedobacter sp. MC2016-05 TaxID=2994474 RepID=UPI0022457C6C|nr:hypothetical protein [Pedobacter sp. MC2016-05]MCX2477290.1 hypothetical protein [Pedobacter sp. MC2016-05]